MPTTTENSTQSHRLVSLPELRDRFGVPLHRTTIWRMTRDGAFPRPVTIAGNRRVWRERDVIAWIESRA